MPHHYRENQIKRVTNQVWSGAAFALSVLALVALILGMVMNMRTGVGVFVAGLLVLLWYHLLNIERLEEWADRRDERPLPDAAGAWGPVFDSLNRRARDARGERAAIAVALERFRAASQAMPDGVIYLSGLDTIEWMNGKAEQHLGVSQLHDLGVPLSALVRDTEFARYLAAGRRDEPLVMQSPRRPATRLLVQIVPFGDGQKMLVSRDITQIEKLETMRQDFIANVSHELRTPLTVVGGFVETVIDGLDDLDREDIVRFLNMALEQSTRMQRLIEDLLALSALETGAPAPSEEQVDAPGLARAVFQEAELLSAGKHHIEIHIDPRDEGDSLLGSQKELHSAFANLASNAVRYTPKGGRIVIGWRRTASGGEFSVEDDGIGIDPMHISRLTERFFRVDRGRSRETGGTGLGLAIVKHVVSRHQAELRIESEPGRGSRFSVCFPGNRIMRRRLQARS